MTILFIIDANNESRSQLTSIFWFVMLLTNASFQLELVGELKPSENWDPLFRELRPPCFSLKWSYLPDNVVPIIRIVQFFRTIGTTLLDNWNHLVRQLEQPCHTNENNGW